MSPADIRQLRRMLLCIASLRSGALSLVAGAGDLLFLRDALEAVDASWDEAFTAEVATLESAGTATPEQVTAMGATFEATVARALDALEEMVTGRLPADALSEDGESS